MFRPRQSPPGFSLIELLVVISVIAILASILMPVMNSAKQAAKKSKCASNLQQLGRAFSLYVSDWSSFYPSPGGVVGDYNYWSQSGKGGLVSYVGSSGGIGTVWCCPELTRWESRYPARTYCMNSYLREPPDVSYPQCVSIFGGCCESKIETPRRTILLFEGMPVTRNWPEGQDYIFRCGNWECVRGWSIQELPQQCTVNSWKPWHGEKNNYLYCDGHIQSFKPNKYPNKPPFSIKNEWWVEKSKMALKYGWW
ncbi:MAG: type II secretion system protein [Armatimonadota bacterium]